MSQITPYKGPGGLTPKQQAALKLLAPRGPAAVEALRKSFVAQKKASGGAGGGGGGRRRRAVSIRMPNNNLYRDTHYNQSTKQLQKQAWTVDPASSNMMAPRGLGYYDAFVTDSASAMTHMSIGPATPITAKTTCLTSTGDPISTDWKYSAQMLVIGPSTGQTQAVLYRESTATGTDRIDNIAFDSTQLITDAPSEAIPTRCSSRVRNFTNQYNMGGLVRVLRATTGMYLDPDYTSNDALASLMQGIRDHRRTVTYTGPEFVQAMQKNAIVSDQSRSLTFTDFNAEATAGQLPWFENHYGPPFVLPTIPGGPPGPQPWDPDKKVPQFVQYAGNPTFSPIIILFEPYGSPTAPATAGPNTYEVILQSQFLAHYRQGSMLANMAIEPASNHAALDKHRNTEERKGSFFEKVAQGVQGAAKFAWDHKYDLLHLGGMLL